MIDIIIPYASTPPKSGGTELRYALRSIERNFARRGKIYIVTDNPPKWLQNVEIVSVPDKCTNNKDANLFDKILEVCKIETVTDNVIVWLDDEIALKPVDIEKFPIYNNRNKAAFEKKDKKWAKRMVNTLDFLESKGVNINYNFDSHTPHLYSKRKIVEILTDCDYVTQPGYCLDTLLSGLSGCAPKTPQEKVKYTAETPAFASLVDYPHILDAYEWLGFNDAGYFNGIENYLCCKFQDVSIYEKDGIAMGCGCKKKKLLNKTKEPAKTAEEFLDEMADSKPSQNDPIVQRRFWDSVKAYAAATYEWYMAGKPSRTAEEMEERFGICCQCQHFIQIDEEKKRGRCGVCGCYLGVNPHRFLEGNKIAMKTQECPEGKWK